MWKKIRCLFSRRYYNVLFFGSDDFSVASLSAIQNSSKITSIEVVTPPQSFQKSKKWKTHSENALFHYANKMGLITHCAPPKTLKEWHMPLSKSGISPN